MNKLGLNPYLPFWETVPDGEPHVFGDRVYVYGSHDTRGGDQFCTEDYVCYEDGRVPEKGRLFDPGILSDATGNR